jgi:delta 1-pyrroline-5-carboxylate dehydrogenase
MKKTQEKQANPAGFVRGGAEIVKAERAEENVVTHRLSIPKAWKMYVGGAFVRSESGRYFQVVGATESADANTTNIPLASRKDFRDAMGVAQAAQPKWAARTAYNRGQILYRLAEILEARSEELVRSLVRGGATEAEAALEVAASIDRSVYYAGFADKIGALLASSNPVAGPHFAFTVPEPIGVFAVLAPQKLPLLGLVTAILPLVCAGNTVVAVGSDLDPRTVITFCEALATSDFPGGVINVLTGRAKELAPWFVKHREVRAIEAYSDDAALLAELERGSADAVRRTKTHHAVAREWFFDDRRGQGLGFLERAVEHKSIWHPVGL